MPAENRLGEEGQGLKIALEALDGGRVGIAAQAVGIAQGAFEAAVSYAKQRRAFGKTISEFQAIQFMLADMQTEIEAARVLVWQAAWLRDHGRVAPRALPASRAKLYASEMVNRVAYKAVQIHGSMGYSRESDVERMYRDARVLSIYEGTSEIQRMIIARDLLNAAEDSRVAEEIIEETAGEQTDDASSVATSSEAARAESGVALRRKRARKSASAFSAACVPPGALHIGHYFGALQNWMNLQKRLRLLFLRRRLARADHRLRRHVAGRAKHTAKSPPTGWPPASIPRSATMFVQSSVPRARRAASAALDDYAARLARARPHV